MMTGFALIPYSLLLWNPHFCKTYVSFKVNMFIWSLHLFSWSKEIFKHFFNDLKDISVLRWLWGHENKKKKIPKCIFCCLFVFYGWEWILLLIVVSGSIQIITTQPCVLFWRLIPCINRIDTYMASVPLFCCVTIGFSLKTRNVCAESRTEL